MDVLFDSSIPAYTFTVNENIGVPNVQLSVGIDGDDVLAQNVGADSVDFISAALHTNDGEVFSYLRFPKLGISGLINVTVVWTLTYA
jgi:hypothetical protein